MGPKAEQQHEHCFINEDPAARLSDLERLTVLGGTGLDRAISRVGRGINGFTFDAKSFANTVISGITPVKDHEHLISNFQYDATPFPVQDLAETPIHVLSDGCVTDLNFSSAMVSEYGDESFSEYKANNKVWVRLWEGSDLGTATVVAVHGWTMGEQRINSLAFLPGIFLRLGLNLAIIELPFHGRRRTPTQAGESGNPFPNPDPTFTRFAMSQALSDLRQLKTVLVDRGHQKIGCMGMSLGGYSGALWSSLDKLDFGIFMVPLVSMSDLIWDLIQRSTEAGENLPKGINRKTIKDLFAEHCMLNYPSITPQEDLLVLGGRGDHLIPQKQLAKLRRHWPNASFKWLSGGHGAGFRDSEKSLLTIVTWMKERGILSP